MEVNVEKYAQSLLSHGLYPTIESARREAWRYNFKAIQGLVEPLQCPADLNYPIIEDVHESNVLICNNCKEYWIKPKERCDCGSTTLTVTHASNSDKAKNR